MRRKDSIIAIAIISATAAHHSDDDWADACANDAGKRLRASAESTRDALCYGTPRATLQRSPLPSAPMAQHLHLPLVAIG